MPGPPLINASDSLLVVIDVQDHFVAKLPPAERLPFVSRLCWLMRVARYHGVPVVVTAEDVAVNGGVCEDVAVAMPPGGVVHDKLHFGLAAQADILAAVEAAGRRTAVLAGMETDVCVAQSAIGLAARGLRVVVPLDVVASPGVTAQTAGVERMRAAGVLLTSAKSLHYEWLGGVQALKRLKAAAPELCQAPPGVVL